MQSGKKTVIKDDQRDRIIKRHKHSVWMHGHSPQALFWGSEEVQKLRFDILLECGISSGDSILDVGCGFGDLYAHMQEKGINVDYTGIDLSPDMIEKAGQIFPNLNFFQGDLFDFAPAEKSVDWVLLSGALNEPLQDDGEYLRAMLPRLYASCRKGLAFNLLNGDYQWSARELYTLHAYKPDDVITQLTQFSDFIAVRTDYLDVDASFFVWRDEKLKPQSFLG